MIILITLYIRKNIATKIIHIYTNVQIKLITYGSSDYWNWVRLREIVLRLPLLKRFSMQDLAQDRDEIIFGIYDYHKIIGGAQLVVQTNKAKMRQVAVSHAYQNKGFGNIMLQRIEEWSLKNHIQTIYCHAREQASSFYLRNGYRIRGDMFMEVGIPHFYMEKLLAGT